MCSKTWLKINSTAETIGFSLSIIFQTTLLFLIFKSPKSKFGTYKYLMILFSAAGIFYSTCNFLCKPNVHITETTFVIFMILEDFGLSQVWGTIVIAIYSSCFGMMLSLLTLQFYYRFVSVSSPLLLSKKFSLVTVPKFMFLVFGFSIIWGSLTYFINGPNYLKNQELEPEFLKMYCLELQEYSYIAAKYFYSSNSENEKNPHWPSFIVMSIMTPMMGTNFSLLMFFGFKTYSNLRKSRISSKKDIQHQLFRTLVLQTLIPSIFMYLPVSCLFYFPIFGIQIWDFENFIPISVAIYPCLEPLVAIFCIKLFRVQIIKLELVPPGKRDFEEERFKKQAEQNFHYQNNPILQLVYVTFSTDSEKKIVEMELSEHDCYFQVLKKADEIFPLAWTEMVFGDPENLDYKLSNSTDVWNFIQQSKLCKFNYLLIKLKFSEKKRSPGYNKCVIC